MFIYHYVAVRSMIKLDLMRNVGSCRGRDRMIVILPVQSVPISPLTLRVRTPLGRDVLDTILCDKVCQ